MSSARHAEEAVVRRRQLEEGYEVPMNFSFRRSKKGDSVVASTTRVDRNASGNRVAVTNDEIVAAKPRGGGKAYGIWKQRPIGRPEATRSATVEPVNYSSRRDRPFNTMRTSPASTTRLMPQQIPFRHKPEAIERPDADTRISDRLRGDMQALRTMKSTVGNMVRDARAGMSSMSDVARPGMADRPRPGRKLEW